tara:strand:+ start:84877 stop:85350 length:474 start_codon:yes stop_codon:yes gene_type:complete
MRKEKKEKKPSKEQRQFTEGVRKVFDSYLKDYGFEFLSENVEKFSSRVLYKKENKFIDIHGSTYPTDYPYHYFVDLGKNFNIEDQLFPEYYISLPRLVEITGLKEKHHNYNFPFGEEIEDNLLKGKDELDKYAMFYLNEKIDLFEYIIKIKNKQINN